MRPILKLKTVWEPLSAAEAYANLSDNDRATVEAAARCGDWVGKYNAEGFSPEHRIWAAIEAAFEAFCASPRNPVPFQVRDIFARMAKVVKPTAPARQLLRQATQDQRSHILQSSGGA